MSTSSAIASSAAGAAVVVAATVVLGAVGSMVAADEAPSSEQAAARRASAALSTAITDRPARRVPAVTCIGMSTSVMLGRRADVALKRRSSCDHLYGREVANLLARLLLGNGTRPDAVRAELDA